MKAIDKERADIRLASGRYVVGDLHDFFEVCASTLRITFAEAILDSAAIESEKVESVRKVPDESHESHDVEDLLRPQAVDVVHDDNKPPVEFGELFTQLGALLLN